MKKYLVTRAQTMLPPKILTLLLQNHTDFINLTNLRPAHLQQWQIRQIQTADILALTSYFALTCALPFLAQLPLEKRPKLAVTSPYLESAAIKLGFRDVMVSRSEHQDSLATMLRARLFRQQKILWLRGNLSDRYNPLNLTAPNWQALTIYKNQLRYQQFTRLQQLLRANHYQGILISSNSAFERIIQIYPNIDALFISLSYRGTQLIKKEGYLAQAPRQKENRLSAAVKMLLKS